MRNSSSETPKNNRAVLREMFHTLPEGAAPFTCSIGGDPNRVLYPHTHPKLALDPSLNHFVAVSSFLWQGRPGGGSVLLRRNSTWAALHMLGIDDVGTKVEREDLLELLGEPTLKVETSPGNEHWFYVLDEPVTDRRLALSIVAGACRALGYSDIAGLNRLLRLPLGVNGKPKYTSQGGRCPATKLVSWRGQRFDPLTLFGKLGGEWVDDLTLSADVLTLDPRHDPIVQALKRERLIESASEWGGSTRYVLSKCPWTDKHTDRVPGGSCYIAPTYFGCKHDSCSGKNFDDLRKVLKVSHASVDMALQGAAGNSYAWADQTAEIEAANGRRLALEAKGERHDAVTLTEAKENPAAWAKALLAARLPDEPCPECFAPQDECSCGPDEGAPDRGQPQTDHDRTEEDQVPLDEPGGASREGSQEVAERSQELAEYDEPEQDEPEQDEPEDVEVAVLTLLAAGGTQGWWRKGPQGIYLSEPPEPEWLFDEFIRAYIVWVMAGEGGVGKSLLSICLSMSIASGKAFGPFRPSRVGPSLILSHEDDRDEVQRRVYSQLQVWREMVPWSQDELRLLQANLLVPDLPQLRRSYPDQSVLLDAASVARMAAVFPNRVMTTVDPLGRFWGGASEDERSMNSQTSAARVNDGLDRMRGSGSILAVHHLNKAGGVTGSKQITDYARAAVTLRHNDSGGVTLAPEKINNARAGKYEFRITSRPMGPAMTPATLEGVRYLTDEERVLRTAHLLGGASGKEIARQLEREFEFGSRDARRARASAAVKVVVDWAEDLFGPYEVAREPARGGHRLLPLGDMPDRLRLPQDKEAQNEPAQTGEDVLETSTEPVS